MSHDLDSLSEALVKQMTSSGQVFVVPRSQNEQEANAEKTKAEADQIRENTSKIKWYRRVVEGFIPGFLAGCLICIGIFLAYRWFYY